MYKLFLASILAFGILAPTETIAKPSIEQVQVKKKKPRKKAAKVQTQHNPFLRCEGFNCDTQPKKYSTFTHEAATADQTAAEFFRQDKIVTHLLTSPLELPYGMSRKRETEKGNVVMEAKKWEGKTARRDRNELKELFADVNLPIDPARIPWCAAFANAILNRTGYETTNSLMARSFLYWGVGTKEPKDGDVVVLRRGRGNVAGHVGFFQGYEWFSGVQYVKVLGGNTDHAVQVGHFPVSAVLGYRTAIS